MPAAPSEISIHRNNGRKKQGRMDALVGYGSDEDSSSSDGPPPPVQKNALSDLLGTMAASDDSDEEEECHGGTEMPTIPQCPSPAVKKIKREPPSPHEAAASPTFVPRATPILATDEHDSTIYWRMDYLNQPVVVVVKGGVGGTVSSLDEPVPTIDEWNTKLHHLASTLSSTPTTTNNNNNDNDDKTKKETFLCWADHLRAQHEFHNPHFFASVVEHFGVKESLGSVVDDSSSSSLNNVIMDYERQLFPVTLSSSSEPETTATP